MIASSELPSMSAFVMNDRAGIEQAFADYRATGFGGWPWPVDDAVHARDKGRFARHPDGRVDVAAGVAQSSISG